MTTAGRRIFYAGATDPRVQHELWCKVPHPNAIVDCTCMASSTLSYQTGLEKMSLDQFDVLYEMPDMPVHKLKAIRHKRHVLDPDDPRWWPKDRNNQPYNPRKHGYPANWLGHSQGPEQTEVVIPEEQDLQVLQAEVPLPILDARKAAKNYWEVDPITPFQPNQSNQVEPPEFSAEKLARMQNRRNKMTPRPAASPLPPPLPSPPPLDTVVPTKYAQLPREQQLQQYPPQGPAMVPHTQQQCRAPLLMDLPGSPPGSSPVVLECSIEPGHYPNGPHMVRIPGRRTTQVIYVTWMDD